MEFQSLIPGTLKRHGHLLMTNLGWQCIWKKKKVRTYLFQASCPLIWGLLIILVFLCMEVKVHLFRWCMQHHLKYKVTGPNFFFFLNALPKLVSFFSLQVLAASILKLMGLVNPTGPHRSAEECAVVYKLWPPNEDKGSRLVLQLAIKHGARSVCIY